MDQVVVTQPAAQPARVFKCSEAQLRARKKYVELNREKVRESNRNNYIKTYADPEKRKEIVAKSNGRYHQKREQKIADGFVPKPRGRPPKYDYAALVSAMSAPTPAKE
jgi:hypothetical protein